MKKIFLILIGTLLIQTAVQAGHYKTIAFSELPDNARNFISTKFQHLEISYTAKERDFLEVNYKVIFVDGNKLEFDRNGDWEEIDFKFSAIPEVAIPAPILDFVTRQHAGESIIEIDRDRWDYEVKLSNEMELRFDNDLNFIGLDD